MFLSPVCAQNPAVAPDRPVAASALYIPHTIPAAARPVVKSVFEFVVA